jgi:asparagine synthase (glutamine-hydrolysing)
MCGIAGKVFADAQQRVDEGLLHAMCRAIVHRGPDDQGIYVKGAAGIGMRRLQVIDIEGGHQPMSNEDGSLWIVFNGEIYNFQQLRKELLEKGHRFSSSSDTETILHLYEDEGVECLQKLRGMFAFAIWDEKARSLLLARDRLGKKPLYYAAGKEGLTFASELGSVMCDSSIERKIDPRAIDEYLTYLFVPHPRTIYRDVRKLPPASYALYEQGKLRIERYWNVSFNPVAVRPLEENVERLEELLREAVQLRMLADVPVGAFLSGGLDSSLIVAMMQRISSEPVRTFSIGFEESSFNELNHAREVAQVLGTEHEEYIVRYDVQDLLPKLVDHFGEPFADSSAIPVYHLSKATRKKVTVALSGDGGDEVFGGYRRYQARMMADAYNRWPGSLGRNLFERGVSGLREPATYYGKSIRKKLKRFTEFARVVRETPETSWAFFLLRRKRRISMRKILPIYSVKGQISPP